MKHASEAVLNDLAKLNPEIAAKVKHVASGAGGTSVAGGDRPMGILRTPDITPVQSSRRQP
jgi:hypothetical protein